MNTPLDHMNLTIEATQTECTKLIEDCAVFPKRTL
jgi:hypothetical protein